MNRSHLLRDAGLLGVAAAAGLAVTAELRNRRALTSDHQYQSELRSPLSGAPVQTASADGTELYAEVFGDEDLPTVFLVPGWTEELRIFDLLTRGLLDRGFRVVGCDLRGQGASAPPVDGDQRIERYAEDLEALLAATCDGRPNVIVAGHSMGAMELAAWADMFDATARVRGAVMMNTGVAELVMGSKLLPERLPSALRSAIGVRFVLGGTARYLPVSTPLSRAALRYSAFGPQATPGQIAFYEPMLWHCPPQIRAAAGMTISSLDLLEGLQRLTVPTVVIAGENDRMTPPSHAQQIADALPEVAELLVLPQTGHMAPLERPEEIADAFARLAARLDI